MNALVAVVVCTGMLVVLPLGLSLVGLPGRWWLLGAVPAVVALWLPRGVPALLLSVPYLLATVVLAGVAVLRFRRDPAVFTALVAPLVAGSALVAERGGYELLGFSLGVLRLTVAHFHFAGFAAALIAGLVSRLRPSRPALLATWSVPAGTAVVFAGYFVGDWVELAGALLLTAGMWLVGWVTWRDVRTVSADRWVRTLFGVAAVLLPVTMVLALSWAFGEAVGVWHPSLTWMAATHGLLNALGFGVCAVLGFRRLRTVGPWS